MKIKGNKKIFLGEKILFNKKQKINRQIMNKKMKKNN